MEPQTPPPAALALEILDALMVIATPGWRSVRLTFAPAVGGTRVVDITTTLGAGGARPRVSVGIEPGAMHGAVNEAAGDLRGAMAAQGVAWDGHALRITRDEFGGASVQLLARSADEVPPGTDPRAIPDGPVRHTLELAPSALEALLFTEAFMAECARAEREVPAMQSALAARLVEHDAWNFDQEARTLTLRRSGLTRATLPAGAIGSYAGESESWLWAWANQAIDPACTRGVAAVRDKARTQPGLSALWRPALPGGEGLATVVAGVAAVWMNARGIYRARYDSGVLYLAIDA